VAERACCLGRERIFQDFHLRAFEKLYNFCAFSQEEFVRVLYRFIGEGGDPKEFVKQGTGKATRVRSIGRPNAKHPLKVDTETGEIEEKN
jgi:hypothetical protein